MKTFYKVAAVIAVCAVSVGLVLGIAGAAMGGTAAAAQALVKRHGIPIHFWFDGWKDRTDSDGADDRYCGRDDTDDWYDGEEYDGYGHNSGEYYDHYYDGHSGEYGEETYDDSELGPVEDVFQGRVDELEWEIDFGKVTIRTGDGFSIKGKNIYKGGFQSYVEGGKWYISYKRKRSVEIGWDWESGLDVETSWNPKSELIITIPEKTVFDDASIDLGAGEAILSGLSFRNAEIYVGAGSAEADGLTILEEGMVSVGMGELILKDLNGKDVGFDCGIGNIKASGKVDGDNALTCGIGKITMELDAAEKDYNYEVSCGLGSVRIGNSKSYTGISSKEIDNGADRSFEVDCGIGTVEISFHK